MASGAKKKLIEGVGVFTPTLLDIESVIHPHPQDIMLLLACETFWSANANVQHDHSPEFTLPPFEKEFG